MNSTYKPTIVLIGVFCLVLLVRSQGQDVATGLVENLPSPTGPSQVGRRHFQWSYSAPKDLAAHPRWVIVTVYYPAAKHGADSAEYFSGATKLPVNDKTEFLRNSFGPAWKLIAANKLRSHATENAPISKSGSGFPVLLFSPGVGIASAAYSVQLEDIASHGYVVVALDHPYDAPLLPLSDGILIPFDEKTWSERQPPGPPTLDGVRFENERQADWVSDSRFVLQQLQSRSEAAFFSALDLRQIGAFGHSMGGVVAMKMCQTEKMVRACLNEDGDMSGRTAKPDQLAPSLDPTVPVNKPLLIFSLMEPGMKAIPEYVNLLQERRQDLKIFLNRQKSPSYLLAIDRSDMGHRSFSDIALLNEKSRSAGSLQLIRSSSRVACAFFDQFLRGNAAGNLNRVLSTATIATVSVFPQ